MKLMKSFYCVALWVAIASTATFSVYAEGSDTVIAGDSIETSKLSSNTFFNRDIEFRGSYASDRTYITVDKHWQVKKASLLLALSVSGVAKTTALKIAVNDRPIHSELLRQDNARQNTFEINIPIDALKEGSNEVRVEVSKVDATLACVNDQNDGTWVLLRKTSYIHLDYDEIPASNRINEFPYPFLKADASSGVQSSSIVIPAQADNEETAAALQVAAGLGAWAKTENLDLNTITYSSLMANNERKNEDLIFIGKLKHLPEEIRAITPQEVKNKAGEGALLYRIPSPYKPGKMIMAVVTDREDGMLDLAAKLLLNHDLTAQMDADIAYIAKGTDVSVKDVGLADQMTLKGLGYTSGINLKGPFRQQATVGLSLPPNRQVLPGAKAILHIRYSKNIDFSKSLVTVFVNGTPVGSKQLELVKADGDTFEVNLPNSVIASHYLELKIAFDLQMTNANCVQVNYDTPWAYVGEDSSIYLPTKGERALLLENYPWPFIKDGKWNNTAVVLPNESWEPELDFLGDMFAYMGKELRDNTGSLSVIKEEGFSDKSRDSNFIMIGAPKNMQALRNVNNYLWFKYDDSFNYFLSNEKRQLLESFSRNLASIQLTASPFNNQYGVLFVTAPQQDNIRHLKKFLTTSKFTPTLVGNALLVDRWEDATNHYFVSNDNLSLTERVGMSSMQFKVFSVMFTTVLVMLIVGFILYIRKFRRR